MKKELNHKIRLGFNHFFAFDVKKVLRRIDFLFNLAPWWDEKHIKTAKNVGRPTTYEK
jgi:hypothetical protein